MARVYDDVKVTYTSGIAGMTDEQLGQFDYLVCHMSYWDVGSLQRAKRLGLKLIYDFDDYWELEPFMRSYHQWKHINIKFLMFNTSSHCDLITCTTPILAGSLRTQTKVRVEVMPNGIDPHDEQWRVFERTPGDRIMFGYVSGFEHMHDIEQVFGAQSVFDISVLNTLHPFVPAGFKKFDGKKFTSYAKIYDEFDVVIAPLIVSRFNRHKSELKMIEAGFKCKPIIVSNVEPYTLLASDNNCLKVNKPRPSEWIRQMRRLSDSRSLREDIASQLYEDVKDRYNLNSMAVIRRQLYESIC